jgi:hypothetical protein
VGAIVEAGAAVGTAGAEVGAGAGAQAAKATAAIAAMNTERRTGLDIFFSSPFIVR